MKQGWEVKTLAELALIKGGKRIPKGYCLQTKPTSYPYIRVTDFNDDGSVDLNDIHFIEEDIFKQIRNYTISKNDLYISIAGTIGKTGIIPEELDGANLTENACKLEFYNGVEKRFIYYFTKTNDFIKQAGLNTRVAAMPKLALSRLSTIRLSIPKSLYEQQRIVAILDEAFEAIAQAKANAEKNLKNARELFDSYLQSVFENKGDDWEERTFSQVCEKITDGTHQTPKYFQEGVVFLSSKNVTSGKIDWEKVKYIDQKQHLEMHRRLSPQINDILLAKNGTTGVAAIVDRNVTFDIYVSLALIRVLESVLPRYMLYFINSPVAKSQFNKRLKGIGVPNLHLEEIREVLIKFPKSLIEQQKIVQKIDALSTETKKMEALYQQKIDDLEELKKSLLQKAFNGELKTLEIMEA